MPAPRPTSIPTRRALSAACLVGLMLAPHAAFAAPPCAEYQRADRGPDLGAEAITEASGLVASRRLAGVLWLHNDSGDGPFLYAIRASDGASLGRWEVTGARARDWEDIAIGPCDAGVADCLYIADIGNNSKNRDDLTIYRVPEPRDVDLAASAPTEAFTSPAEAMRVTYPFEEGIADDNPDAEGLLVDPRQTDEEPRVYVLTKENTRTRLLSTTWRASAEPVTLTAHATLPIGVITAAAWRPDGARFAMRSYGRIYEFDLPAGERPATVFANGATRVMRPGRELQGESLGYTADGAALITVSEGNTPPLWFTRCVPTPDDDEMDEGAVEAADMAADTTPDSAQEMSTDAASSTHDAPSPKTDGCASVGESAPAAPWLAALVGWLWGGWRRRGKNPSAPIR